MYRNYKLNSPFSKIPLLLCSFMLTVGMEPLFSATQEIPSTLEVKTEEEAFLVRRIAEFWKDRDYLLVKRQIHTFLEKFPNSPINDQLRGILGDLYLQEKKYQEALDAYAKITDAHVAEKVIVNRLQCYYELNNYAAIYKEGRPYLAVSSKKLGNRKEELNFLVAESMFRMALETSDQTIKQDYAAQAKSLYEPLITSNFSRHTKLALAEIYHILKQYEKAAVLYIDLASQYPEQKEDLLNQAALSQAEYDPQLAIVTFSEVINLKGKKENDAAMNRLILFFQEEDFAEVIKYYPEVMSKATGTKKQTLDYIVGRSYYAQQDYKHSSEFLGRYISSQTGSSSQLKNALLMQLNCAQQTENHAVSDSTIDQFKTYFSQDKEFGQALYIHAIMAKNRGDLDLSEKELAQVIQENKFDDRQSLFMEYGLVTHENAKWDESYKTFKLFIDLFPKSENRNVAFKYLLSSCLNKLKEIDENPNGYSKEVFYDDLTLVLNEQSAKKTILSSEEEKDCRLLSAKTAYELKRFPLASKQLESFIKDFPADQQIGEAHLLLGICYQNTEADPELFYHNIEKAIAYNPELANQSSLHLQLYNAYLNKIENMKLTMNAKSIHSTTKDSLYDLAADHLYKAIALGDHSIKQENKIWLANHYYQKVKQENKLITSENLKKSLEIYKSILIMGGNTNLVLIGKETLHLEPEILKYVELLSIKGAQEIKVGILANLAEQQTKNNQLKWSFQTQTFFELAQTYELLKDEENALETYNFIIKANRGVPSYVTDYALLHSIRLRFNMMESDFKNDKNEQIITILNQLKDLQIKKSPSSEPLHLEAGLAYAKIRAEIAPKEEKDEKYLFYLGRLKEDYTSLDDSLIKEYHKRLSASSEKQDLFKSYMGFIESEELRTKAKIAVKNNQLKEAEEFNSLALMKLSEVKSNDKITVFLSENVQRSIHLIDQTNRF